MDLLEHQGKELFRRHGLAVSEGAVANNVEEAVAAGRQLGYPVVVKAQVLTGGRGKAGGVKLAGNEQELRDHAARILGLEIRGHRVKKLWIERASEIASEYYAAVLLDRSARAPLVMFSSEGGVEIEEVARRHPEKLARRHINYLAGLGEEEAVQIARAGQAAEDVIDGVAKALCSLYEVFCEEDATLAEINPLIVTPEREVRALDAKVTLDDNARFRHPDHEAYANLDLIDPLERRAKEEGVQYVQLDGDIGILGNGAGLVMSTLDVVAQAGGRPANFLDAGGGANAEKIRQATELILSNPAVKAVLFNIFGGITRCDEVAKGLIEAFSALNPTLPFVVRLDGTNAEEGRRLLAEANLPGVHPASGMEEAAKLVVALAGGQEVKG